MVRAFTGAARKIATSARRKVFMKNFLALGALSVMLGGLAFAENFSGRLLDATCVDQSKTKACDPTSTSSAFVMIVNGKAMRLDDAGNAKAVKALRSRSDRQTDPNAPAASSVMAKVTGTAEGDIIRVDVIQLQ
jgi:hypothetical protein